MATAISRPVAGARRIGLASARPGWRDREATFSWLMMALPLSFLLALVGYPFVYGIYLSLENRPVAQPGVFVGLQNFIADARDPVFWQVTRNTVVYTGVATVLKMVGGLALALIINQSFRTKNLIRAALLLPFIVPTVLSTVAWMWMLDPAFSVVNWLIVRAGLAERGPSCSATRPWRWPRSSSSTRGAACRSTPSPCWRACRRFRSISMRLQRSTAPARGRGSGMSRCRCSSRRS
jgi:multiple sugar transport system permease protein